MTTTTTSDIWLIAGGEVRQTRLDPAELGLAPASRQDLVGGDVEVNAAIARRVLAGETGPVRDRLAELGCELAQGFYFSVPRPAEELDLGVEAPR